MVHDQGDPRRRRGEGGCDGRRQQSEVCPVDGESATAGFYQVAWRDLQAHGGGQIDPDSLWIQMTTVPVHGMPERPSLLLAV